MVKGAGANDVGYNPLFDTRLAEARRAADVALSHKLANEAQLVLLHDLPVIPLWDYVNVAGRGENVSAQFNWNGLPDYVNITKASEQEASDGVVLGE